MMPDGIAEIAAQLLAAGIMGGLIGFERRVHHKAIGIAGMVMIAIGSTTYMLLATHLAQTDPSSISRTLQGFLSGIGFLGGAVIFKSGFDVKGIKAAAAAPGRGIPRDPASPALRQGSPNPGSISAI